MSDQPNYTIGVKGGAPILQLLRVVWATRDAVPGAGPEVLKMLEETHADGLCLLSMLKDITLALHILAKGEKAADEEMIYAAALARAAREYLADSFTILEGKRQLDPKPPFLKPMTRDN